MADASSTRSEPDSSRALPREVAPSQGKNNKAPLLLAAATRYRAAVADEQALSRAIDQRGREETAALLEQRLEFERREAKLKAGVAGLSRRLAEALARADRLGAAAEARRQTDQKETEAKADAVDRGYNTDDDDARPPPPITLCADASTQTVAAAAATGAPEEAAAAHAAASVAAAASAARALVAERAAREAAEARATAAARELEMTRLRAGEQMALLQRQLAEREAELAAVAALAEAEEGD
jgi:hypothetical protein